MITLKEPEERGRQFDFNTKELLASVLLWAMIAAAGISYVAASNNDAPTKDFNESKGRMEVVYPR